MRLQFTDICFSVRTEKYTCYPSYKAIGYAVSVSVNTDRKFVAKLEERKLIAAESTVVPSKDGQPRNGTLRYTIRPIQEALDYDQNCCLLEFDVMIEQQETDVKSRNWRK